MSQYLRITSYNVCYTKLLRISKSKKQITSIQNRLQKILKPILFLSKSYFCRLINPGRITSYNVCYTKLLRAIVTCCRWEISCQKAGFCPTAGIVKIRKEVQHDES